MPSFLLYDENNAPVRLLERLAVPHGTNLPDGAETNVIYWGTLQTPVRSRGGRALNAEAAHVSQLDGSKISSVLRRHGIQAAALAPRPSSQQDGPTIKLGAGRGYIVPVFHLQPLGLFASPSVFALPSTYRLLEMNANSPIVRSLTRAAVRSVYSLGLDFGNVHIAFGDQGSFTVMKVDAAPQLDDRLATMYAAAIEAFARGVDEESEGRRQPVVVGTDPEFILRRVDGKIVSASKYLAKKGVVGCDSVVIRERKYYPLVELRPDPSPEPAQLIANLHQAMEMAADQIGDDTLMWLAGGMPYRGLPLGGHLHLSGVWLNAEMLRCLDNYLALPLVLIEDSTTANRRPKYGFLGDFRLQPHGGFEYRTLPSWLVSPKVASGVVALAVVIAKHYRELRRRPLASEAMQQHYYDGNKAAIGRVFALLRSDLERLSTFAVFRGAIEPLFRQMERKEPWNEQEDIRRSWKIKPYS